MGRSLKASDVKTFRLPDTLRRQLVASWFRQGRRCYYCSHGFTSPALIEVAHIVSWRLRWDLRLDRANLAPSHGGGRFRCPLPECNLACNQISHQAPDAPFNHSTGASLPFTDSFMAREIELRRKSRANPRDSKRQLAKAPATPVAPFPGAGREW